VKRIIRNILIFPALVGYVISYLIGGYFGYYIVGLFFGNNNTINNFLQLLLSIFISVFVTAPCLAIGYHKLLERFNLQAF